MLYLTTSSQAYAVYYPTPAQETNFQEVLWRLEGCPPFQFPHGGGGGRGRTHRKTERRKRTRKKMCHPGLPFVSYEEKTVQSTWLALQVAAVVDAINRQEGASRQADGVGVAGSTKQCLCSPTQHPGSFRCRHHQADYQWGGRIRHGHTTTTQ
ncbi:hypothetical protein IFM89_022500 [Coptis chinensis]|uniref:Uncharacterized protein n=1 Tax=Coptis chinensis TaxID=261450 RepID=A0A835IGD9_9MAGN|nr:hypothetical protein IFM89_022500 [Coptis chinensis]